MPIAVYKAASRADRQHPTLYAAADTVKILAVSEEISLTAACETTRSNSKACLTFDLDDNKIDTRTDHISHLSMTSLGAYDITADELLAGTDTAKTESKTAQAQMLILELLADGKRMPSAELEKAVNERGISSRTMRTAKSRIGDRLVTEKDGTAWVCYLRN